MQVIIIFNDEQVFTVSVINNMGIVINHRIQPSEIEGHTQFLNLCPYINARNPKSQWSNLNFSKTTVFQSVLKFHSMRK